MKKMKKLLGIAGLALAIGFSMIALSLTGCSSPTGSGGTGDGGGGGGGDDSSIIYVSSAGENTYELTITEAAEPSPSVARTVDAPNTSTYVLVIFVTNTGALQATSSGTFTSTGGTLALKPEGSPSATITVTISGSTMTSITGTIGSVNLPGRVTPSADEGGRSGTEGGYSYTTNPGGATVRIDKYNGAGGAVTIPAILGRKPVTSIGFQAFAARPLSSVTIPTSITSIGKEAFLLCENLTAINVDASNTAYSSDNGVLYNKNKTTLIKCPAKGITGVYTIPDSVTSIEEHAFSGCTSLTSVTIPDSVTSIGNNAFLNCTSLTSITLPNNVTSIGDGAFSNTNLASVAIPDSITSIRSGTFFRCASLASVTIGNSIASIGGAAFGNCTSLTSVTFSGTIPESGFNTDAFYGTGDLRDKYLAGGPGTYTRPSGGSTWTKQN